MKTLRSSFRRPALIIGLALVASCSTMKKVFNLDFVDFPETRVANLEALHQASGKHRYTAVMVGDTQYAFSRNGKRVAGMHIGKPPSGDPGEATKEAVRNPAEMCLELLNELLEFDASKTPRLRSIQISWCARLVDQDPSIMSRERAAIGLGELGEGLDVGGPRQLELDEPRADAEAVAGHLSKLMASFRAARDGQNFLGSSDALSIEEACDVVREETYDLDGARRVLYACATILQGAVEGRPETVAMTELVIAMETRTIELALGRAMLDQEGLVRGAGAAAAVRCSNELVFAQLMGVLRGEEDSAGLYRFLAVLKERGLPQPSPQLTGPQYQSARESWLDSLMGVAIQHPESHVRTRAMQVLTKVTLGGPNTLREEDWEAWWFERHDLDANTEAKRDDESPESSAEGSDEA